MIAALAPTPAIVGKEHSTKPGCFARYPVKISSISTSLTALPWLITVSSNQDMKLAIAAPSTICARRIPSISALFFWAFIGVMEFWESIRAFCGMPATSAKFARDLSIQTLFFDPSDVACATMSDTISSYGLIVTPDDDKCFCTSSGSNLRLSQYNVTASLVTVE